MITKQTRDLAVAKSESGALFNLGELALVFDVGRDFVKAMTRTGFKTFGGRTTTEDALKWLRKHPDFKTRQPQNTQKLPRNSAIPPTNSAIRPAFIRRNLFREIPRHRSNRTRPNFLCVGF